MKISQEILRKRLQKIQDVIAEKEIDAVMLRTLSSFIYFTGLKWLRPALLIPAEGEPIAFIARGEEEGFTKRTYIKNIVTFIDGGDLMAKVSGTIRREKYKVVGLEFSLERDAYILFYEMFKRLNPRVKVIDVSQIIAKMKMEKDDYELSYIRKAGEIASKAMKKALSTIEPGMAETEIAAELYSTLYKMGCEKPHVYINVGPDPRVHTEPFRDIVVKKGVFVTIIIGADYNRYYANMSRTTYIGKLEGRAEKAVKCMNKAYKLALELTKPEVKFIDVMKKLDEVYAKYELLNNRLLGYVHGVGLQIEEPPITTIVPQHRQMKVKTRMVIAFIHAPIMMQGLGQVKREDTFIVKENGELENITKTII
ncbi:MAG: Xaa-Pro peptidase family protein [archaeon GB-1867-005]|nr:Xaa-Pro peptidase family protein [Candidatus Culexmicrobium cathedralense]